MLKYSLYACLLILLLTSVCIRAQTSTSITDEEFNKLRSDIIALRKKTPLIAIEKLSQLIESKNKQFSLRQTLRLTYAKALFQIISNLPDEAHHTLTQCKLLSLQLGEPELEYYYYSYSGRLFNQLEAHDLALLSYQDALNVSLNVNNSDLTKESENNIGHTLLKLGRMDEAEIYFKAYYQYAIEKNIYAYQSVALNNLGEISLLKANIDEALTQFKQSLAINEQYEYELNSSWSHHSLGKVYRIKKQFSKAVLHINKAIMIQKKFDVTIDKLNTQLELAAIFQDQKKHNQALKLLMNIAKQAKDKKNSRIFYLAQNMLKHSYKAFKQYDEALLASEESMKAQKAILEQKAKISFQHIVAATSLKTKELELSNLKKEKAIAQAEQLHSQNQVLYVFVTSLTVIFITFLFVLSTRKKNKKLRATLSDLETTQKKLIESEKVSALTTLVSGMAHQLNTPLGVIVTANSVQQEKLNKLESLIAAKKLTLSDMNSFVQQSSEAIILSQKNTHKADEMIRQFKLISAELEEEKLNQFNIKEFIESKLTLLENQSEIKVKHQTKGENISIYSYPEVLLKVLNQLVTNSIDHKRPDNQVVEINILIKEKNDRIIVQYTDNGPGIDKHLTSKIFDPFFTTKGMQTRLGLGLNIAYNSVMQLMQGTLTCCASDTGAMFVIELPKEVTNSKLSS